MDFKFGDKGTWKSPGSEENKIKPARIPAVVLEQTKEGLLYIFTLKPTRRGWNNLSYRTATIFPSDWIPDTSQSPRGTGYPKRRSARTKGTARG